MKDKLLWFSTLLVLTGLFGFTTVADDLRHPGELVAVSTILLAGAILFLYALRHRKLPRSH